MTLFGRSLAQYVRFQGVVLGLIVLVGLARLGLSLAGAPNDTARWLSINVVDLVGIFYYGVAVHLRRFGGYNQILPLLVIQQVLSHLIVIAGILLHATGRPNIYAAPEYSGGSPGVAVHVAAHVLAGMVVAPLIGWLLASIVLFVTRKIVGWRGTRKAAA